MIALVLALAACDRSAEEKSASDPDGEYPLVTTPSQPDGPTKPSATEAEAGTTCERMIVPSPEGLMSSSSRRLRV